ncbi:hypothetical protein [Faecalibacter sp. LW9]|uniref:hypothetical protein n=1 Tax=Faecalibacter sp. LW9 TaxID=3103144 RepID=UPI002AFF3299|nr:hypothetical protein [Faecalibacter sp. LW9]
MKMKFWGIILPILILFSCGEKKKETQFITFSGQIKNATFDSVYLILNEREKGFALDFDGNFSDTVQLNQEGYKTLALDREEFPMYLIPGDSIAMTVDLQKFDQTFYYKGKGADRNLFLYEKEVMLNDWMANEHLFRLDPDQYLDNINDFTNQLRQILKSKGLEKSFETIEQRNIYFNEFQLLYAYRDSYAYFNPTKPQLPVDFIDFKRFNLDNEEDYKQFTSYRNIVIYYFDEQLNRGTDPELILGQIQSKTIRFGFIRLLLDNLDPNDPVSKTYYEAILKHCDFKPWRDEAQKIMGVK